MIRAPLRTVLWPLGVLDPPSSITIGHLTAEAVGLVFHTAPVRSKIGSDRPSGRNWVVWVPVRVTVVAGG